MPDLSISSGKNNLIPFTCSRNCVLEYPVCFKNVFVLVFKWQNKLKVSVINVLFLGKILQIHRQKRDPYVYLFLISKLLMRRALLG